MHLDLRLLSALALLALAPALRADSLDGLRSSVTQVGDVNADGVPDLAVASRDRDRPERVWILSGKDGTKLLEVSGKETGDRFGSEVVSLGDWDRDGTPDFAIEARPKVNDVERWTRCYRRVVSGKSGATLLELDGVGPIGGACDVDGDGKLDLLLANKTSNDASISVLSGADRHVILRVEPRKRLSGRRNDAVEALAWIDDQDGDDRRDFCAALSVHHVQGKFLLTAYELTLHSGRDGSVIWTRAIEPDSSGFFVTLRPIESGVSKGNFDVLVGIEDRFIQILRGKDGEPIQTHKAPRQVLYSYGSSLDVVGDMDRDGWEDWILGANESWGDFFDAGICDVVSGKTGEVLHSLMLKGQERFGYDACGLGDVSADGVPDFAVGAERQVGWTATDDSEPAVQVRSGKDASLLWMKRHVDLRK